MTRSRERKRTRRTFWSHCEYRSTLCVGGLGATTNAKQNYGPYVFENSGSAVMSVPHPAVCILRDG